MHMREKTLTITDKPPVITRGTAAMTTFIGGMPTTASALAQATGGIGKGRLVEPYA